MKGDEDPSKAIISTMAKLLGNSAFGSCITDVEKHRDIKIITTKTSSSMSSKWCKEIASRKKFKGYEALSPHILEVTFAKDSILYPQLRQISNVIFDGSKTTMRTFIDFCFNVLEKGSYQFMSTDTDSIYIALKNGPDFEANLDPNKRDYYAANKHPFFVTDKAKYGERTPGLFKIEATGTHMIALCAKSYVVYNDLTKQVKFSCKCVQKDEYHKLATKLPKQQQQQQQQQQFDESNVNKNVAAIYERGLNSNKTYLVKNRGMKRTNGVFSNYEQEKKCSTSFYCKRLVLDDGIHTVPLNI